MRVSIWTSLRGGIPVLHLADEVDSAAEPRLDEALTDVMSDDSRRLVVDLAGVTYMSGAPLARLIGTHARLRADGGALAVASASRDVRRVFELAGLSDVFHAFDTVDEAADYVILAGRCRVRDRH